MRPQTPVGSGTARDADVQRVATLAKVLDGYFLDPLMGLVLPGAGDVLGSLLGMYTVMIAVRRKVSPIVIARMIMNLGIDALIGFIPLFGDIFDFGFKANKKNAALLAERIEEGGGRARARDWLVVVGAALGYFLVMAFVVWGIISIFRHIM